MRLPISGTIAAMAISIAACSPPPQVQTVVAPDTGLGELRTFRVVEASDYLGGMLPGETHPAFVNSQTSQALGDDIAADLERRGYTPDDRTPDVLVEYGTAVREPVDPTDWAYEYLWRPSDWRGWGPGNNDPTPAEYAQGAVIIDMVDARTRQVLWRGHAVADATGDERTSLRHLDRTVGAIIDQLPERTLASR